MNDHTILALVEEHLSLENLELRDRVRDLEADNRTLREMLQVALDQLHDATEREREMTRRVRQMTERARRIDRPAAA